MKNIKMIAALSLLSLPVYAQDDDDDDFAFYAGLAGGLAYDATQINRELMSTTTIENIGMVSQGNQSSASDAHHFSGVGQLQIGAGFRFDVLYLGLEALGQLSNGEFGNVEGHLDHISEDQNPSSVLNSDTQLQMNEFEPSIDFKPGLFLSQNTLLYGRIGAAFNEMSLEDQAHYDLLLGLKSLDVESSESENVIGLRLGLGVEHHLHEAFNIFIDYTYTSYEDISLETKRHATATIPNIPYPFLFDINTHIEATDVSKQVVMLGFNYYL